MLAACGLDIRALASVRIATVGSGTAERLTDYRLFADFLPTVFRGDALLAEFRDHCSTGDLKGLRILRVRGDHAPTSLEDGLRESGAAVDTVLAYHIRPTDIRPDVADVLAREGADAVTFTSGSSVNGFEKLLPEHGLHDCADAICIGPVTAKAAAETGWRRIITAKVSTVAGLVACTEETLMRRK
jgi:uroporphyrinogen III methyltransferase/synthase